MRRGHDVSTRHRRRRKIEKLFLGKKIDVLYRFIECCKCKNPSLNGLKGLVIDVSRNTLTVITVDGKIRTIIKDFCWYYVKIGDEIYLVNPRMIR